MLTIYDYQPSYRGTNFVRNQATNRPGDRVDHYSIPEWQVCQELGYEVVSGVGRDKQWSSSSFLDGWTTHVESVRNRAL